MKSVIISTRLLTLWVLAGSSMSSCSQPTGQLLSLTSLFFHPPPLPRGLLCSGGGGGWGGRHTSPRANRLPTTECGICSEWRQPETFLQSSAPPGRPCWPRPGRPRWACPGRPGRPRWAQAPHTGRCFCLRKLGWSKKKNVSTKAAGLPLTSGGRNLEKGHEGEGSPPMISLPSSHFFTLCSRSSICWRDNKRMWH